MQITPKQRRRAVRVHFLSLQGNSHKEIAESFKISRATVRADLQLIETHWSEIAAAAADDLLLESLQLLEGRVTLATRDKSIDELANRLTPVEYLRARDARETQFTALAREIRRTVHEVHQRVEQRPDQPALDQEEVQETDETSTKLTISATPKPTISSPEQEIVQSEPEKEKLPQEPDHDALIQEAITHFPHLKGQSETQILQFLDQLTTPEPKIYAEAAG